MFYIIVYNISIKILLCYCNLKLRMNKIHPTPLLKKKICIICYKKSDMLYKIIEYYCVISVSAGIKRFYYEFLISN